MAAVIFPLLLPALGARSALAQPASKDEVSAARDQARQLAEQGIADIDHGSAADGVALLEQAEAKFHAPTHLLYLARGYDKLGKPGLAAEAYERLIGETLPNYAPDAFRDAQRLGRDELPKLHAKLGRILVSLKGAKVDVATIAVDGRAPLPLLDAIYVEPGHHVVVVSVGAESRTRDVTLADREDQSVEIVFGENKPSVGARTGDQTTHEVVKHPFVAPAIVVFAVAGAAVVAGTATGVLSLNKVSTLSSHCPTKMNCRPSDQSLADDARTLGNVSTAMFVIGGVGTVTGLVLALVPVSRSVTASGNASSSLEVEPVMGAGSLGIRGRF